MTAEAADTADAGKDQAASPGIRAASAADFAKKAMIAAAAGARAAISAPRSG
jgi:hypothetical protein